jgi:hypothetical protein
VAIATYIGVAAEGVARLPVSLPPRPPLLAGREGMLTELQELLTAGEAPRTVVLCGMGGVGKTSLAGEYAHRHLAEVGIAWQIPSEDAAVVEQNITELAAQLGARDVVDPRDPVASVHAALAAYPAHWLLIFDNATDEASVRRFLPPAGRGRIVITSQSQHWAGFSVLNVPVLESRVAARLLVSRAGDPDQETAAVLAEELGGLPLALEQAAAYMRATGLTIATYLRIFRLRRADLLGRGTPSAHAASVVATLALALSRLEPEAREAAGLLRLLACLAPEPVPLALLLALPSVPTGLDPDVASVLGPLTGDPVAFGDAVEALRRYSLVTLAGVGMVIVHRLVQNVIRDQMPPDRAAAWKQAAASLVEAAIPPGGSAEDPKLWSTFASLLPHAQTVLADDSWGRFQIAHYLGHSGNYRAARDITLTVAEATDRSLGADHPTTLLYRVSVARWAGEAGDPAAARDLYAEMLPKIEQVFGPDHFNSLAARSGVARWTGEAGDPAEARELTSRLVSMRERVLGAENPTAFLARAALARWTGMAGDPAEARDLCADMLPSIDRILGPGSPNIPIVRAGHAHWTGEAGDPATARDLFAALVPDVERILGIEHPETLTTRAELARWTGEAGDPSAARDLLAVLLPILERVLGREHSATLAARSDLAYWAEQVSKGDRTERDRE